ncbi:hypothetical protein [Halomonas chromatireducens]|uniref:Uncharacterized protein n=1 Tax=Halomonas chromatireducens TaxID=507626 RepID=A0A109UKR3_9GAMM|nr:hypothetical protein [Halomonas chromatireducens]AMC99358.1 hypothetical protein LOKO_00262 [Halomonas chromatireducens]
MEEDNKEIFRLSYNGGIVDEKNGISIRTLGSTLPHFQRAIDKSVIYERDGAFNKGQGAGKKTYPSADLMFYIPEEGSFVIPLFGKVKKGAVEFFNWAFSEPYNKAIVGDVSIDPEHQVKVYRARIKSDDVEHKTQKDLMVWGSKDKRYYARSAMLQDMDSMFSVIKASGSSSMRLDVVKKAAKGHII